MKYKNKEKERKEGKKKKNIYMKEIQTYGDRREERRKVKMEEIREARKIE